MDTSASTPTAVMIGVVLLALIFLYVVFQNADRIRAKRETEVRAAFAEFGAKLDELWGRG